VTACSQDPFETPNVDRRASCRRFFWAPSVRASSYFPLYNTKVYRACGQFLPLNLRQASTPPNSLHLLFFQLLHVPSPVSLTELTVCRSKGGSLRPVPHYSLPQRDAVRLSCVPPRGIPSRTFSFTSFVDDISFPPAHSTMAHSSARGQFPRGMATCAPPMLRWPHGPLCRLDPPSPSITIPLRTPSLFVHKVKMLGQRFSLIDVPPFTPVVPPIGLLDTSGLPSFIRLLFARVVSRHS